MKTRPSLPERDVAHWRHFFRSRDAALACSQPVAGPRRPTRAAHDNELFAPTEWADTEWPDTCTDPENL